MLGLCTIQVWIATRVNYLAQDSAGNLDFRFLDLDLPDYAAAPSGPPLPKRQWKLLKTELTLLFTPLH